MKKLYKSRKDKKIAGVCAGIGNYLGIDPTIIRFSTFILLIFTGFFPIFIAYLIAAAIIPLEPSSNIKRKHHRLYRSRRNRKLAGVLGGIAEYFKVDATLIRIIYIILLFITGVVPLFFCYMIAWMIMPERSTSKEIEID